MDEQQIALPVAVRCVSVDRAAAFLEHVQGRGAPAARTGRFVSVPGDQPAFLFMILEVAFEQGWVEDGEAGRAISEMEAQLADGGGG